MSAAEDTPPVSTHFDAIIIGAGFGGLRMIYELRQRGLSLRLFEAASDVGGTWYWNRYPGARTDTEAWAYCFSFSKELQDEWDWPERMPTAPQMRDYLGHVADRFDMRKDIQFNSRIRSAIYNEAENSWTVTTEHGDSFSCTYLISASGLLTIPVKPPFPGVDDYQGELLLSSRWPKEPVSFAGKRVALLGSGSTAVQMLPVIARSAEHVTIFQRTPSYVLPGRNYPLDDAEREEIRTNYDKLWSQVRNHVFAFPMTPANRIARGTPSDEQQRVFESGWEKGGFRYIFETFDDLLVDEESNAIASEFVRNKIRAIVDDPKTAELLCPTYPLMVKRPAVSNFYYECFNKENVSLVDLNSQPIETFSETGIRYGGENHEFDIVISALGFDAVTGTLTNIDLRGRNGLTMKDRWAEGPRTYLGMMVDGFPNMFMISGPQSPFANIPPVIEGAVLWIGEAIAQIQKIENGAMEPNPEAVERWRAHMNEILDATILRKGEAVHCWFLGANIPGKPHEVLFYLGGANQYFGELDRSKESGFSGFTIGASPRARDAMLERQAS